MSRPARKILQIWACPHCQGKLKVDHWQRNPMPQHLEKKWSHCPEGFRYNQIECVCPHCQKYITPFERRREASSGNPIDIKVSWNAALIYDEAKETKENWKTEWESLPYVELKKVNEILSGFDYPPSFEVRFRLHVWQESNTFNQHELAEIDDRKKVLLKNPLRYFYYILSPVIKMEKLAHAKRFEDVRKLIQDETELKQLRANQEPESKLNMHRLLDLLPDGFEKAEIYRHLGLFDECINTLQAISTKNQLEIDLKEEMLRRAKRKDTRVFKIDDGLDEERAKYRMR